MPVGGEPAPDRYTAVAPVLLKEKQLRGLITDEPSVLPGVDEGPVAVAWEVRVPPKVGRADVVVVDADGRITIVECKLATSASFRRRVIGQVFSYAAGLWRLDYEEFAERFAAAHGTTLTEPFTMDDAALVRFRRAVSQNLEAGAFQLVVAVDEVTAELDQTVDFLDRQTLPNVRIRVLLCGDGSAANRARSGEALVAGIRARNARAGDVAEDLLEWAGREQLDIRPKKADGVIKAPDGATLFRIVGHEEMVRVPLRVLRSPGAAVDEEPGERIADSLEEIGLTLKGRHLKAPLESLADDESRLAKFKLLMKQAIETENA